MAGFVNSLTHEMHQSVVKHALKLRQSFKKFTTEPLSAEVIGYVVGDLRGMELVLLQTGWYDAYENPIEKQELGKIRAAVLPAALKHYYSVVIDQEKKNGR